ncbi:MAG: Ldh family oxidoreductase [Bryobacterales bacterium]|nr:Ldh family oxidoreductase [Bryobacterales bacterium]
MQDEIIIPYRALGAFGERLLLAAGAPREKAALVAESLLESNLRGIDSHGYQLLPYYLERLQLGTLDPRADGHVASERGPCMVYDGENGIGQWIAAQCSDHAIRLARQHGMAMVVSRESNHFGAAAFWGQRISRQGLLAIVTCNASASVFPWQGRQKRFGTNPICMSVPGAPQVWLLDMATTTVAMGRLYKAEITGENEIPAGWAMDEEGRPTTSTAAAFAGSLMPLGGYKGYGLAMMAEILCAVLSGGVFGPDIANVRKKEQPNRVSQSFLAIDVSRFAPLDEFQRRMEAYVSLMKSAAPAAGYDKVLVAGEPEWHCDAERRAGGIRLSKPLWERMAAMAARHAVPVPEISEAG